MRGRADADHLKRATAEGRAIVTANRRDFTRLHAEYLKDGVGHAGIVIVINDAGRWANRHAG
jgi:hypothetical protein